MKEFFERHDAGLNAGDLRRHMQILIRDLGRVLDGYELIVRLFDSPEQFRELPEDAKNAVIRKRHIAESGNGALHLPVVFQGEVLALVTAKPQEGRLLPNDAVFLLPAIIRLSLEKILLYKINITDRETGLNNYDYFLTYLRKKTGSAVRQATEQGQLKPLTLSGEDNLQGPTVFLLEVRDFGKVRETYGRIEAAGLLSSLADKLRQADPKSACLARVDAARIGVFYPKGDPVAFEDLLRTLADNPASVLGDGWPSVSLSAGMANFPRDFSQEISTLELSGWRGEDLAELLMAKAEQALKYALDSRSGKPALSFSELLQHSGRVLQVLPYNRVVVNLGRLAGAAEGQAFILKGAGGQDDLDLKGEVVLFDVRDDYSLGEVIHLRSSLTRVEPEDTLTFNHGPEKKKTADLSGDSLDALLGIPDHHGFISRLNGLMDSREAFVLMLVRVDDYDRYRTTMGHIESERQFKALYGLLCGGLPDTSVLGRFSTESLMAFIPGMDGGSAYALGSDLRDRFKLKLRQTVSFGIAAFPCGSFGRAEMVANAQKALEHATFLGPSSVALFDSVSLNISGDKKFESGDWQGAIEEYNLGLELNGRDLNILNSLGVCYGYQKKNDQALEAFSRVLEIDPDNLMAHFNLGFALASGNRPKDALNSFRRAAEIAPANFDALFQLARMYLDLDMVDDALVHFQKAAALDDRKPIVYRYLGQTLLKAERTDEAVDAFKAAARSDPEDAPSLSQLGVLFLQRGRDTDVALSLIRQAVRLDQTNSLFRQRLARALTAVGDLEEAADEYRQAVRMGARSRDVYFELGQVLRNLGKMDEAREHLGLALQADPEFKAAAEALEELDGEAGASGTEAAAPAPVQDV